MPRTTRKSSEAEGVSAAEPRQRRSTAVKPAAAGHKRTKTTSKAASGVETPQITHEQVATLAYSYWEARGRQGGSPEHDWLRAERELLELAQNR